MKILGCAKIVPDLDLLSEEDWHVSADKIIDTSFARRVWNCFDEGALEMMLEYSAAAGGFGTLPKLDVLTIGDCFCDSFLKTLYALGFHSAVRVAPKEDWRFRSEKAAEAITSYVKKDEGISAVVMGCQALEGNNYKTPLLTAEMLHWQCITEVLEMLPAQEGYIRVRNMTDEGILTQEARVPCVLSVGNRANSYLRVPTLRMRMQNSKKEVRVIPSEALINEESSVGKCGRNDRWPIRSVEDGIELKELIPYRMRREALKIEGGTPREKAKKLFCEYMKGRLEAL